MSTLAIYVLVFMIISSLLGFLVAWAWTAPAAAMLKASLEDVDKNLQQAQSQQQSLQEHTNQLEKEKEKLVYENERLTLKLNMLLDKAKNSDIPKTPIENNGYVDTSSLDKKINDLQAQIAKLNSEIDVAKRESLEWQVQYSEIMKEKEDLTIQLHHKNHQGKRN